MVNTRIIKWMGALLMMILLAFGIYTSRKSQSEIIIRVKATSVMALNHKIPGNCGLTA
jgi:Ni,Fe-hydrogenase I cytochrome b subunit